MAIGLQRQGTEPLSHRDQPVPWLGQRLEGPAKPPWAVGSAWLQVLLPLGIAAGLALGGWTKVSLGAALLTGIGLTLRFAKPDRYAQVAAALQALGRLSGRAMAYATLIPLYFLVITPLGLWRRQGRDPLHRVWQKAAPSYWQPHASQGVSAPEPVEQHRHPY